MAGTVFASGRFEGARAGKVLLSEFPRRLRRPPAYRENSSRALRHRAS